MHWLYRKPGRRYVGPALAVQLQFGFWVVFGGVALMTLFLDVRAPQFWRVLAVSEALVVVVVENILAFRVVTTLVRPADAWLRGDRSPERAVSAWEALAGLPLNFMRYGGAWPALLNIVPISAYITYELDLASTELDSGMVGSCPT